MSESTLVFSDIEIYITRVHCNVAGLTEGLYRRRRSHISWWCLLWCGLRP